MSLELLAKEPNACAFRSKRWFAALMLGALVALHASSANASNVAAPPVSVNGTSLANTTVERSNVVFVPIRGIFEKLGANVTTSASSLIATKRGREIARLKVGSRDAVVDGSTRALAVAPFVSNGMAMLPLRVVGEAAGASVVYVSSPRAVRVTAQRPVVVAQAAAPVTTDAATAAPAAAATQDIGGIPWWVWALLALLIIAILIWLLSRRKKDPVVTTASRGRGDEPIIKTRK